MSHKAFCAFCTLPLKIYGKQHVAKTELAVFSFVSMVFTFLVWGSFHFVGLLVFAVLTITAELIHRMRWRASVKCRACGFDPVIYKHSPEQAAGLVKIQMASRKEDPLYMLRSRPVIKPIIRKTKDYIDARSKKTKSPSKEVQPLAKSGVQKPKDIQL